MPRDWEDVVTAVMMAVLTFSGLIALGMTAIIIYVAIQEDRSPTFSLRKDQWQATASHQERTVVLVGKVPVSRERTVIDQWSRVP